MTVTKFPISDVVIVFTACYHAFKCIFYNCHGIIMPNLSLKQLFVYIGQWCFCKFFISYLVVTGSNSVADTNFGDCYVMYWQSTFKVTHVTNANWGHNIAFADGWWIWKSEEIAFTIQLVGRLVVQSLTAPACMPKYPWARDRTPNCSPMYPSESECVWMLDRKHLGKEKIVFVWMWHVV